MSRVRVLPLVLLLCVSVAACGKSSPVAPSTTTPPTSAPPTPPPSAFSLSGRITESAPTTSKPIPFAVITIVGGPQDGFTTAANENGDWSFPSLSTGTFTVRAGAAGFTDAERQVTLSSNQTGLNFNLVPIPQTLSRTITDAISGGDPVCIGSTPCKQFRIDTHHAGTVTARLRWNDRDTWLWFGLYRASDGSRMVEASQSRTVGLFQDISTGVQGGQSYVLVVRYALGSRVTPFEIAVTHPN